MTKPRRIDLVLQLREIEAEIEHILNMSEAELREECAKEGTTFDSKAALARAAFDRAEIIVAENISAHLRRMQ